MLVGYEILSASLLTTLGPGRNLCFECSCNILQTKRIQVFLLFQPDGTEYDGTLKDGK